MVRISDVIAPSFFELSKIIKNEDKTHFFIKGGRGSGKSSFISIEIITGLVCNKNSNAVILRRYATSLKDSVYSQIIWAINTLGLNNYFEYFVNPMKIVYKLTGQTIVFLGLDDPQKLKSFKFGKGYAKYIWFEELSEIQSYEIVQSVLQSLMRGNEKFCVFYSFNPPKSHNNWVNKISNNKRDDMIVHNSTYLDVPQSWLGEAFIKEAEHLKKMQLQRYKNEYLGEVTGNEREVFLNIELRQISDDEISEFDNVKRGLDWGYATDPLHYSVLHYDNTRKKIFVFFEIHKRGMQNIDLAELIKKENTINDLVLCDSAEPKSIDELKTNGIYAKGVKKGAGSVDYGIKFLQGLEKIIIDPVRCPNCAKEFFEYEYVGNEFYSYNDKNNHSIDAVRYALNREIMGSNISF